MMRAMYRGSDIRLCVVVSRQAGLPWAGAMLRLLRLLRLRFNESGKNEM